jgi:hypothetical protein
MIMKMVRVTVLRWEVEESRFPDWLVGLQVPVTRRTRGMAQCPALRRPNNGKSRDKIKHRRNSFFINQPKIQLSHNPFFDVFH